MYIQNEMLPSMIFYSALHAWWLIDWHLTALFNYFELRWQGFRNFWRLLGKSWKKRRSSISFFYSCHRVLADLTPRPLFSSHRVLVHISLDNDISFLNYCLWFCMQYCRVNRWVRVEWIDSGNLYLFVKTITCAT